MAPERTIQPILDYLLARSEHPWFSEYPLCPTISGHSTIDKVSAQMV
jgi:hypothetical protein